MRSVWKYDLWQDGIQDNPVVHMPSGAETVFVAMQGDALCVWAIVDIEAPTAERKFHVRGTGHEMDDSSVTWTHIGSVQHHTSFSEFVWHVFEED